MAVMVLAVTAVHVALLSLGFVASRILRFERGDAIAVAFSGSQKTLMIGAYIAMAVGALAILPMVAYHAAQLIIDTLVADWWRGRNETEA
jgi:solute carrier family 10 (sodium/bile acid cotransporter), member 7